MEKIYKEPNKSETETTINVLYSENMLSIYKQSEFAKTAQQIIRSSY